MIIAPGRVNNVTGEGTNNTILLEWTAPIKNPHCVKGYEVKWNNQTIFTKETHALIEGLEPCSMFPVTVNALSNLSHKLHETPIPFIASTNGVGKKMLSVWVIIYVNLLCGSFRF